MRFCVEQRFRAPLAAVEEALVDPGFLERLGALPKLRAPRLLDRREEGDLVHLRVRYVFVGELSPAVTAVVDPARLSWVEESTLDRRSHTSTHLVVPDHYGGRLQCRYRTRLEPANEGCLRVAEGEVRVRIPFVGGLVEQALVSGLREHAHREAALLEEWIGREG